MGRYTGDLPTETDPLLIEEQTDYSQKSRRRRCCLICAAVTFLVLLAAGLLTYFLFPRIPDVQVASDEIVIKQWSYSSSGAVMDILVPVYVYNPNYVPLTLSLSQCDIYYTGVHFAYGKPVGRTRFPSMTTTSVMVEILLLDSMRNNSYISNMLTGACGNPPSSSRNVKMELKATIKVAIVAEDISVPYATTFNLPCTF